MKSKGNASYLDVSQYIIKQHSPVFRPSSPGQRFLTQAVLVSFTPQVAPIDHDPSHILLTPITSGLIRQQIQDIMDDFILDTKNPYLVDSQNKIKHKKSKKINKQEKQLSLFKIDCQLEHIFEDSCEYSNFSSSLQSSQESQSFQQQNQFYLNDNFAKWKSASTDHQEEEKLSTSEFPNTEFIQKIQMFKKHPKAEIMKRLKQIQEKEQIGQVEKKILMKKILEKYIVDYQTFCFEQAWNQLPTSISSAIQLISKGVGEVFAKKIGPISYQARRVKLLTYLEKKKSRKWRKKVSYDCRKRVADGRLRIKGKFVTREQVCSQLGFENLDDYTAEQIKELMQNKMDENLKPQIVF